MYRHGWFGTPLYGVWAGMKARCNNPNHISYHNYGGRGITVCDEWDQFEPFKEWAMSNGYKKSLTLDRINNSLAYSPNNCRWSSVSDQANNRRTNKKISYNGRTMNLSQWAVAIGISTCALYNRLFRYGWPVERALTEPVSQTARAMGLLNKGAKRNG